MNILYIGSGFVGACSAAVSADSGHNVLVYDIDEKKIKALGSGDRDTIDSCIFEDGLCDLLVRHKERIEFTTDYKKVEKFLDNCDGIFMCLPTPEIGETGESNLEYYYAAAEKLAENLAKRNNGKQEKYIVIINKSTVPIAMVDKTQELMDKAGVKNYGVVSNPEFLVEGQAIAGSIRPNRVVVGAWNEKDFEIMRKMYQRFYSSSTVEYIEVNPKEAAAGKLLANFSTPKENKQTNYKPIFTQAALQRYVSAAKKSGTSLAVDLETDSLKPHLANIVGDIQAAAPPLLHHHRLTFKFNNLSHSNFAAFSKFDDPVDFNKPGRNRRHRRSAGFAESHQL